MYLKKTLVKLTVKLSTRVYFKGLLKRGGRQLQIWRSSYFDKLNDTFTKNKKYISFIKTGKAH